MNDKCIICGGELSEEIFSGLIQCKKCKFITTNTRLSDDELKSLYSEKYFNGEEYTAYIEDKQVIQQNFRSRLRTLLKHIDNPNTKKMFEIGCAYGLFLDVSKEHFKSLQGIDISSDAVSYAKSKLELDVISGNYLEYQLQDKKDVICMWDTIEHLKNPELFIEKASKDLNTGGLIAITTGDISSMNARIRRGKWRQIHPPTHLHYFSKETLQQLLINNGFEIVSCTYPASKMSLKNIAYIILMIRSKNEKLYNFLDKIGVLKYNILVNMFDLMYIIARKK